MTRPRPVAALPLSAVLALLAACAGGVPDPESPGAPAGLSGPFPVFNAAYAENHEPDRLPDVLARARGAYVLLDPFADAPPGGWAAAVAALRANGNEVGAYVSVGTGEDWRDDFAALRPHLVATPWDEWGGEFFVSSTAGALPIMAARIDRVAAWGFDWVEFDNMDWAFDDDARATYGFAATPGEAVAYYRALCARAHARGLRCMAKNTVEGAEDFDGVLYESYADDMGWWDEAGASRFARAGRPVIVVHYGEADCAGAHDRYRAVYGSALSFLCEDANLRRYVRLGGEG